MALADVQELTADCMDKIKACFKPGVKITVAVRSPDHPTRDFLMTDDDPVEVKAMLDRRLAEGKDAEPFVMRPIHIRLLRYAVTYDGVIRLHDDSSLRMGEIGAQGELFRAGFVEQVPPRDPPIPGPPEFPTFRVTEAGRRALDEADPGRPVPKHGSGGSNV